MKAPVFCCQGLLEVVLESSWSPTAACVGNINKKLFPKLKSQRPDWKSNKKISLLFYPYDFFFSSPPPPTSQGVMPFHHHVFSLSPGRCKNPSMTNPSFLGWKLSQKPQHTGEILYLREPPTSLMLKPFLERSHKTICYATLRTPNNPLIYSIYTCSNKLPFWTALVNMDLKGFSNFTQHLNLLLKCSVLWLTRSCMTSLRTVWLGLQKNFSNVILLEMVLLQFF